MTLGEFKKWLQVCGIIPGGGTGVFAPYTGLVASRTRGCNLNTAANGINTRSVHKMTERCSTMKLVFPNWMVNVAGGTGAEIGPGSSTNFSVAIEYPLGTMTRVKFSGSASGLAADNADLISDDTPAPPVGATFAVRVFRSTVGTLLPTGRSILGLGLDGFVDQYEVSGTDKSMSGTIATPTTQAGALGYRPTAIIGTTTKRTFLLFGDSITEGCVNQGAQPAAIGAFADHADALYDVGHYSRPLAASGYAYANLGIGSDRLAWMVASNSKRLNLLQYVTDVVTAYGYNDFVLGSASAQTVCNNMRTLGNSIKSVGKKLWIATVTPTAATSTSTYWLGGSDQSVNAFQQRHGYNKMVRQIAFPGQVGYIDNQYLETARDSGLWNTLGGGNQYTNVTCTSGSNNVSGTFTMQDDGMACRLLGDATTPGYYGTGSGTALLRVLTTTTAQIFSQNVDTGVETANNATASQSGTARITTGIYGFTTDGVHPTRAASEYCASQGFMAPILSAS
ncbi:SGNH/GDSL hydrolase family protein [Herbaspirillum huttiense]|uniref:SGNH/GDSL hydrolase family protein n=2 Tax=Herbaspirillum huttiense TaxID=863372 RepID=A0AAJ2HGQ8_9BURK|nr:SGNH/GDSL hydrolase family protein [Herbaspirillum huttiense]MDR9839443.1 SGNH/GDSL hydrolase family protein [Herbaspirillum huttiense]